MGICFSKNTDNIKSMDLIDINFSDVEYFSLNGKTFNGKIVDVYDGDTCTIVIILDGKLIKFKCRCNGYDSPEMRPLKSIPNRDKVIENANKAKNFFINNVSNLKLDINKVYTKNELKELFLKNNMLIEIKAYNWDKYGRLLAAFYNNNININDMMIEKGYGYAYDGGTKHS